jgi:hypothetical protein
MSRKIVTAASRPGGPAASEVFFHTVSVHDTEPCRAYRVEVDLDGKQMHFLKLGSDKDNDHQQRLEIWSGTYTPPQRKEAYSEHSDAWHVILLDKGVAGGIALMLIGALITIFGMAGNILLFAGPVLFLLGGVGVLRGIVTGNLAGKKRKKKDIAPPEKWLDGSIRRRPAMHKVVLHEKGGAKRRPRDLAKPASFYIDKHPHNFTLPFTSIEQAVLRADQNRAIPEAPIASIEVSIADGTYGVFEILGDDDLEVATAVLRENLGERYTEA